MNTSTQGKAHSVGRGVLLVGHGTCDPQGQRQFRETAAFLKFQCRPLPVEPCFLELALPSVAEGVQRLVEAGVADFTVAPLLLFAAGHIKRDIPAAVAAAAACREGLSWRMAPHLGCQPNVVKLSTIRYDEALTDRPPIADEVTLLILVGRGSHDREATAEMHHFARLRTVKSPALRVETCFVAMARPSLQEALSGLTERRLRRVVIQPHLLFHGLLIAEIERQVAMAAQLHSQLEWVVTKPLGSSRRLAHTVCDLVTATNWTRPPVETS